MTSRFAPLLACSASATLGLASAARLPLMNERGYLHHVGYAVAVATTAGETLRTAYRPESSRTRPLLTTLVALLLLPSTKGGTRRHRTLAAVALVGSARAADASLDTD